MKNNKQKIFTLSLIGTIVLIFTVIGFSYAMFTLGWSGTKENVITTGFITIAYDETTSINLVGQYPMSDILGIGQNVAECSINSGTNTTKTLCEQNGGVWYNSTLSFSLTATTAEGLTLYYALGLVNITEGETLTDDYVKIYLEKDGSVAAGFTENVGKDISDFADSFASLEMPSYAIVTGSFATDGTHNYTLKAWVDENYTLPVNSSESGDTFYDISASESFSFKIKLIASNEIISIVNDTSAPVCTFVSGPSKASIANGETATYVVECTDESVFRDSDITTSDFTIGGTSGAFTITNIAKSTITNGYSYTVTVTGTATDGSGTIRLNAGAVSDFVGNNNDNSSVSSTINVANTMYLYNAGNQYTDLTGGWIKRGAYLNADVTFNSDNIYITSGGAAKILLGTTNKIDFTNIDVLYLHVSGSATAFMLNIGNSECYWDYDTGYVLRRTYTGSFNETYSIDVSSIVGEYYLSFYGGNSTYVYLYSLYGE